jgi:MFS transporter, DHA1 family, inner membrane transport protein
VKTRFAPSALMLGNIVTGCSVLAPAGMLSELSESLDVSIRTAGLLIAFGAVVLCIGSPVTAWLTSRIQRRALLTAAIAVLAITNIASAFAADYASLLVIRLVMLAVGVIYTPLRRPRCLSTPLCSMSGRRSVRASAASSMPVISCTRSVSSARFSSHRR